MTGLAGGADGKPHPDKLQYGEIPAFALAELAGAYNAGADKYGEASGYLQGMKWSYVVSALFRHVQAWRMGERDDSESGVQHLAAVAWCAFALMMYEEYGLGEDDRWPIPDGGILRMEGPALIGLDPEEIPDATK